MTPTPQAADVMAFAVVPLAPPAARISTAKPKTAPNWALKTLMATTGSLLALLLVIRLIVNCWFFAGAERFDAVTNRLHTFLLPYLPYDGWLWLVRGITLALLVAHAAIAVVLALRAKAGRGPHPAKLHNGLESRLTKMMPYSGILIGLFTVIYVLDQIDHRFTDTPLMVMPCDTGTCLPSASSYNFLADSLAVPWLAAVYIVGLLAIAVHVMHGLGTVATIAAGNSVLLGQLRRGLAVIGGLIVGGLLLANLFIPIGVLGGWL